MRDDDFASPHFLENMLVALVGGISAPGFHLIQTAIENQVPIVPIPGPSAVITALSVSGLPTDAFLFKGFLPHQSKKKRDCLQQLEEVRETLIFHEYRQRRSIYQIFIDKRALFIYEEIG